MSWDSVIGQRRAKEFLNAAVTSGRLAHAYLFSGPPGAGQLAAALELAAVVNCEKGGPGSCGECSSCRLAALFRHPNISVIVPLPVGRGEEAGDHPLRRLSSEDLDALREEMEKLARNPYHEASIPRAGAIKVNSIRAIRKSASLTSFTRGKQVFVIAGAERMNEEASNALLKTLEEPHDDTLLLLTTSQPGRLLPTIISRCQTVAFEPLADDEIRAALELREGVPADRARAAARLSRGDYARALLLAGSDVEKLRSDALEFLRTALYRSRAELLRSIDELAGEWERPDAERFLRALEAWLRDCMLCEAGGPDLVDADDAGAVRKFTAHHPRVDYARVEDSVERAISLVGKNVYIPLIMLNLALEFRSEILHAEPSGSV